MRLIFEQEEKTPNFYRYRDMSFCKDCLDKILSDIGFVREERRLKVTYNLFKNDRPNIYWWVATRLADFDWAVHGDGYSTDTEEYKIFMSCYAPHLIMGEDLERFTEMNDRLFKSLSYVVCRNPLEKVIEWCKRLNINLFSITHELKNKKYEFKVEKICGRS